MLGKLLKYDMRAISRTAAPMFAASGIVSVVCCAMLYFTYGFSEEANTVLGALIATSGFYILGVLAIAVLWVVTAFVGISRYYKSLFTDEGYLNMVIPVKTSTLLSAKLLATFIWVALATVVTGACAVIAFYLPTVLYNPDMLTSAMEEIKWILGFDESASALARAFRVTELIGTVFSFAQTVFVILTTLTVGSVLLKKRKVIGCILLYFLINFIGEGIITLIGVITGAAFGENLAEVADLVASLLSILLYVGVCVASYFVNLYILNKKFNIE